MSTLLGKTLRAARIAAGIPGAQLARRVGLDPAYLRRIEEGQHDPPFSTIVRLAQTLRLSLDGLVEGERTKAPGSPRRAEALSALEAHLSGAHDALQILAETAGTSKPTKARRKASGSR